MNNTQLSSNADTPYINQPQSLIKLPIIVALMLCGCFLVVLLLNYFVINAHNLSNSNMLNFYRFFSVNVISYLINFSLFYFCIGLILCISQKMHYVTSKNIVTLLVIVIAYTVINFILSILYRKLISFILVNDLIDYSQIGLFLQSFSILFSILKFAILVGLFILLGGISRQQGSRYIMPMASHRHLFATLFAVIFYLPSMVILLPLLPSMIFSFHQSYAAYNYFDFHSLMMQSVLITPALFTFIVIAINLVIIYFVVKSAFTREFDFIPLKLLFKAVGWSYLYLIGFNVLITIIYFLISFVIGSSMNSYSLRSTASGLIILFSLFYIVVSFIGCIKLTRKAVRKYFG